ncbi:U3 small nucleolar ribonucleoprotein complex, subunit Mpp10 [Mycotypha africana]|uniref:U3 small nucleolar ribonucleoprotein complex, subunit Mpp10 n=1 Tax=Mycotypha africana TaxID=64632 RepID=UPI0023008E43|nr:U3 small nucleolar ribonucleoprotein complex, subunit Mpp10 [Mycotypha africana]KAI8979109.1 U3 small nucleolar ribonucleoprotein complex, subunit Mpp10 [Mycotypha africana]
MPTSKHPLSQFITDVVDKPQVFFTTNQKLADNALAIAKHFYDDGKFVNSKKVETSQLSPFTELFVEGFDTDQVWEELVTQNEPFLDYASSKLKSFSKKETSPSLPQQQRDTTDDESESVSGQSMDVDHEEGFQSEEEDEEMKESEDDEPLESNGESSDVEKEDKDEIEEEDDYIPKKKTSEVDDDFFNLEEFNKWTDEQERLDMLSDREEDDDDVDFDQDLDEEEESQDEEDDEDDVVQAAEMTFDDFFGDRKTIEKRRKAEASVEKKVQFEKEEEEEEAAEKPGSEIEEDDDDRMESDDASEGPARDLFADEDASDKSDNEEEEEDEKSAFQKQQERIQQQIEQFEQENIQGRHWTLQGEATAKARPVNSLLEEDLEFEHANKPVPVITQETTNTLEEMIKKRILDNMFDDVERKVDPTLKPFVPSKRVELSDEKSKQSLAEIYEDDFIHQQAGEQKKDARDEALEKEHDEITHMFNDLCYKLDALSNFHYTPKAVKPEMTIVSNAAAISMEEVTPVNVSEATLLAPEEVYDKKRTELKSTTEMDQAERKRLRAQKKKLKRKEREMKEREIKVMQKYNPQIGQKQAKVKAVKQLLGQKNVTVIGKEGQQQKKK